MRYVARRDIVLRDGLTTVHDGDLIPEAEIELWGTVVLRAHLNLDWVERVVEVPLPVGREEPPAEEAQAESADEPPQLTCDTCGKTFESTKALRKHERTH